MVKESGSERLIGKNNGIFILDREPLSPEDELLFIALSCRTVDIGTSHTFTVVKPEKAAVTEIVYNTHSSNRISCEIVSGAAEISNGYNESPYSMIYANTVFGTLLTNLSCGYSWYANSAMSTVSRRHNDPLLGTPGETICLTADGVTYDLARSADKVVWGRDCGLFCGTVGGISYELRVGVDALLPVKLYHIRIRPETEIAVEHVRAALYFCPSAPSIYSGGILSLLSDAAARVSLFAVSDEIHDSVENLGDMLRVPCAFSAGECGFAVAAFPAGEKCVFHIRDTFRRSDFILASFEKYRRRADKILQRHVFDGSRDSFLSGILDFAAYQALFVRILARSGYNQSGGAYGYRDQLQDSLAALYFCPALTKLQILRCCARQYEDGRVQHWWHGAPYGGGLRTRCSDDYMWLPYAVAEYVLATGDADILSLRTPSLTSPPLRDDEGDRYETAGVTDYSATVLEHCIASINASLQRGEHGLPLIGSGDWNDGMNEVGVRGRGESVWLAFFFAVVYRRFSEMLTCAGIDPMLAERLMYDADALVSAAEVSAWDGGWYVRAFDDDGEPLGSVKCSECKIDLLPQSFSVFADADRERSRTALQNVLKHLYDGQLGILRLFAPSYDKTEVHGYICRYPAGIRENGGQYTHAAVWCAASFFAIGDRETGRRLLASISPVSIYERGRIGGAFTSEPYFLTADIYYGDGITGKSGWSGYTGSAAWFYRITMKYYLGIELDRGGVSVTAYGDTEFNARVRAGEHEVEICVRAASTCEDDAGDANVDGVDIIEKTVRAGERVNFMPTGAKTKILLKVEK